MNTQAGHVTGVDFVSFLTEDLERSADFYENVLGLEAGKRWQPGDGPAMGAEFENGTVTIAIINAQAIGRPFAPSPGGIALQVDDVAATRKKLEEKGVKFHMDTLDSGVCHMAFFADPDGNELILHHRYAPKNAAPGSPEAEAARPS